LKDRNTAPKSAVGKSSAD